MSNGENWHQGYRHHYSQPRPGTPRWPNPSVPSLEATNEVATVALVPASPEAPHIANQPILTRRSISPKTRVHWPLPDRPSTPEPGPPVPPKPHETNARRPLAGSELAETFPPTPEILPMSLETSSDSGYTMIITREGEGLWREEGGEEGGGVRRGDGDIGEVRSTEQVIGGTEGAVSAVKEKGSKRLLQRLKGWVRRPGGKSGKNEDGNKGGLDGKEKQGKAKDGKGRMVSKMVAKKKTSMKKDEGEKGKKTKAEEKVKQDWGLEVRR